MDCKFRIIFYFLGGFFLLQSCAQLGTIEGGTKDQFAPKIIENGMNPPNGSTNFNNKTILFEFDEYFNLNNPQENISIMPADVKISSKINKRHLILSLEGNLKENTTYQISFNNAVKDLNEGNDSLMHYVFSTGNKIDSLTYAGKVADAYTGELQSKMLVALYHIEDSILNDKALYFTKTDANGEFKLDYLKKGSYKLYAFNDLNKDLKYQRTEKVGFKKNNINLDSSYSDSLAILVFEPKLPAKITSKSFVAPNQLKIASNQDLRQTAWRYKDTLIDPRAIHFFSSDSLTLCLPENPKTDFNVTSEGNFDTLFFRLNNKEARIQSEFLPSDKNISEFQKIKLISSSIIKNIDTNLIHIHALDSSKVKAKYELNKNFLEISFLNKLNVSIELTFFPKAIQYQDEQFNDTIKATFTVKQEKEYGSLIFKNTNFANNALIEILNSGKVVRQITSQSLKNNPIISYIDGGEYSFRIVLDENQNGKWDGGDAVIQKQAEKVLHFPQKVKVRANWESEIELELTLN